jgi:alkylhydroperoxidase family enzyme
MMARITTIEAPYDPEVAAYLATTMPPGLEPIGLFRTLARNLDMASAMWPWARHELGRTLTISLREREILIDRTCARCGCEYEWGVHVDFFRERARLSTAQVTSLTTGDASDPCWDTDAERLLIRVADELHDSSDVSDDLWAALARTYDDGQLLDILFLCGWYHAVSFVATAARVEHEQAAPRFSEFGRAGGRVDGGPVPS